MSVLRLCVCVVSLQRTCCFLCFYTGEYWRIKRVRGKRKAGKQKVARWWWWMMGGGLVTWHGGARCGSRCLQQRSLCMCRCLCHLTRFGRCEAYHLHLAACGGWTEHLSLSPLFPRHAWNTKTSVSWLVKCHQRHHHLLHPFLPLHQSINLNTFLKKGNCDIHQPLCFFHYYN